MMATQLICTNCTSFGLECRRLVGVGRWNVVVIITWIGRSRAGSQVNISGECREEILSTDANALDIFDRARVEVLAVMEVSEKTFSWQWIKT